MKAYIKKLFVIILIIFSFVFCETDSKKEKQKRNIQASILQYLTQTGSDNGENAAKIFYINPSFKSGTTLNLNFVYEANSTNVTAGKKKLILIHGWDFNDRDSKSFSLSDQRGRIITDGWADFFKSSSYDLTVLTKSYDVYAFDYLTSNPVDTNGIRLRARMDSLFGNESNTVVIGAHSMGGLVSRFAAYEGNRPSYLNRIITMGTPFHGSPWASPQFFADKSTIGNIAAFLTDTSGGKDLAWDNFDGKISGATNAKLTAINAKKDRDDLFYAYYGSIASNGTTDAGSSSPGISLACPVLGTNFAPSDCIVPSTSATLNGNTLTQTRDLGKYDHLDVKLLLSSMQTTFYNDLP